MKRLIDADTLIKKLRWVWYDGISLVEIEEVINSFESDHTTTETEDYAINIERMCLSSLYHGMCSQSCPIHSVKGETHCAEWILTHPTETIDIVRQWSIEHPQGVDVNDDQEKNV